MPPQRIGTNTIANGAANIAGLTAETFGVSPDLVGMLGAASVQYGVLLPYSRNQESEADALGLHYMAKAAYDPRAAVTFWQSMSRAGGASPPVFLSTHPSSGQRIEQLQALLPEVLPIYEAARA